MSQTHYDRMSTLDASFLALEDRDAPMHVGSVALFDATPYHRRDGSLDFERIEQLVMQIFPTNPRLCQKVWWPRGAPPVWIDDEAFDPSYHFHRVAVPMPGTLVEFQELCGRILSSRLDTTRPLWEAWIVDGIEGNRFGLIWKLHHCIADGIGVRNILIGYLGTEPSGEVPKPFVFSPRPPPSLSQLHLENALHRFDKSREIADRIRELAASGPGLADVIADAAGGLALSATELLGGASPTPLNGDGGAHRRFAWTSCSFRAFREIREQTGAKINDIALAAVAGALRRFLLGRGVAVDELDFKVMVPVNVRREGDPDASNRVSNMAVPLPLHEPDPRRRLMRTFEATTHAKASGQSRVGEWLAVAGDWAGAFLPVPVVRFAAERLPANLVVTNIPGPQFAQYLGESELLASYPLVPLSPGQRLGIALYGYNHTMYWGFNADRDRVPDLAELVAAVDAEIEQLRRAFLPLTAITPKLRAIDGHAPRKASRPRRRKAEPSPRREAGPTP